MERGVKYERNITNRPLRFVIGLTGRKFPDVELIKTGELEKILDNARDKGLRAEDAGSDILLLDVRAKPEFAVSHISGANFIDFDESYSKQFRKAIAAINKKTFDHQKLNIYVYCAVGIRASMFTYGFKKYLKRKQLQFGSSVDPVGQRAEGDVTLPYSQMEITVVEGSIYKWVMEDRPLIDDKGNEVQIVHRCSWLWGKIFLDERHRDHGPCPWIA